MRDHLLSQVVACCCSGVAMCAENLFRGLLGVIQRGINASESGSQVFCSANACAIVANKIDRACARSVVIEGQRSSSVASLMVGIPAVVAPNRVLYGILNRSDVELLQLRLHIAIYLSP